MQAVGAGRSPDMYIKRRVEEGIKKTQALDMIEVQVREQDIEPLFAGVLLQAEFLHARAPVEYEHVVFFRYHQAGSIAPVAGRVRTGSGDGTSYTANKNLHWQ